MEPSEASPTKQANHVSASVQAHTHTTLLHPRLTSLKKFSSSRAKECFRLEFLGDSWCREPKYVYTTREPGDRKRKGKRKVERPPLPQLICHSLQHYTSARVACSLYSLALSLSPCMLLRAQTASAAQRSQPARSQPTIYESSISGISKRVQRDNGSR